MSAGFLKRDLYPSMIKAATVAEKRPVCQKCLRHSRMGRRYRRTHEDEDAIHVALPALYESLVIFLTLLENDGPELRRRIHVLDLCRSHVRNWIRQSCIGKLDLPGAFSGSWGSRDVSEIR